MGIWQRTVLTCSDNWNDKTLICSPADCRPDLARQLEEVWRAVTGLDDSLATVEAGDEDHAEAVEVAVGGAAPLVLDLGCCGVSLLSWGNISIYIKVMYQYSLGWVGRPWVFWSSRLDREPRHQRHPSSLEINFSLEQSSLPSSRYRSALIPPISKLPGLWYRPSLDKYSWKYFCRHQIYPACYLIPV